MPIWVKQACVLVKNYSVSGFLWLLFCSLFLTKHKIWNAKYLKLQRDRRRNLKGSRWQESPFYKSLLDFRTFWMSWIVKNVSTLILVNILTFQLSEHIKLNHHTITLIRGCSLNILRPIKNFCFSRVRIALWMHDREAQMKQSNFTVEIWDHTLERWDISQPFFSVLARRLLKVKASGAVNALSSLIYST